MDLCFLVFGNSLGCFSATVVSPFVFLDPVSGSLLVLVSPLHGRSRDFVDPRLLNLFLRPELPESGSAELLKEVQQDVAAGWHAKMNVEVVALERPLCSADGGGPADGDEGFITHCKVLI